jgi:hypothetical protein
LHFSTKTKNKQSCNKNSSSIKKSNNTGVMNIHSESCLLETGIIWSLLGIYFTGCNFTVWWWLLT